MNTPTTQNAYTSGPDHPFQMITRVLSNVVDMQQNMITNFSNVSAQVESLRVEMRSSLSELRSDIQRGEDKHMTNVLEVHDKEVDRMMRLLENMSLRVGAGEGTTVTPQKPPVDPWVAAQIQQLQATQQQMASLLVRNAGLMSTMPQPGFPMTAQCHPSSMSVPMPPQPTFPVASSASMFPTTATTTVIQPKPTTAIAGSVQPAPPATSLAQPKATPVTPVATANPKPTVPVLPSSSPLKFELNPASPAIEKGQVQPPPIRTTEEEEDGGDHPEAYEPEAHFTPVIPLPELVKVVTGEENEKVLFQARCKVYRYTDKEWKERGTGELKILENPETGRQRIVMRRDQVFKVCINHGFDSSMKIEKMAMNAKAVTWICMDASDGEASLTQLSARFASEELATKFTEVFEKCVNNSKSRSPIKAEIKTEVAEVKSESDDARSKVADRKAGFDWKAPEGSWDCQVCYVNNPANDDKCKCCEAGKDGSPAETILKSSMPTTIQPVFSFGTSFDNRSISSNDTTASPSNVANASAMGTPNKSAIMFGTATTFGTPKENATPARGTDPRFSFGTPQVAKEPAFSFGQKPEAAKPATPTMEFSVKPSTASPASKFSFADAAKLAATEETKKPIPFAFGQKTLLAQSPLVSASNSTTATPTASTFSFKPPATGQKSLFGGSANTPPGGSPFGGTASPNPEGSADKKSNEPKNVFGSSGMFGNSSAGNAFSFSSMKANIFEGQTAEKAKEALGALRKAQPFGVKPATNYDDETKGAEEEYEPDVEFKPVIPLPDLVEVKTGEEGEEVIFKERCKLYRFNRETKESTERGTGEMKILKHPGTGRFRCVMRREQVHKLCANFRLDGSMQIKEKTNAPNVAVFNCRDFSDDKPEGENETFFAKFKTEELCQAFMQKFRAGVATAN